MKNKISNFISKALENFKTKPPTPEYSEYDRLYADELKFVEVHKETIAHTRTLDYLEERQMGRVHHVEEHLEHHGLKFGTPEFDQHFTQIWKKFYGDTPNLCHSQHLGEDPTDKKDIGDFEPEI